MAKRPTNKELEARREQHMLRRYHTRPIDCFIAMLPRTMESLRAIDDPLLDNIEVEPIIGERGFHAVTVRCDGITAPYAEMCIPVRGSTPYAFDYADMIYESVRKLAGVNDG